MRNPSAQFGLGTIVLASTSPRRRSLLSDAGIAHVALSPGVDDGELRPSAGVSPEAWVMALAHLKARAGADHPEAAEAGVVVGADTVCVFEGSIVGQPADEAEARAMISAMSSARHEVLTGVAMLDTGTGARSVFFDRAVVDVGEIGEAVIETYVASGEWRGKAGGYNLLDRVNAGWPITWAGDATSIMGLPMDRVVPMLTRGAPRSSDLGDPV
ncbi:MAG: Maf family protein [Planctomycetota bacterium]